VLKKHKMDVVSYTYRLRCVFPNFIKNHSSHHNTHACLQPIYWRPWWTYEPFKRRSL